MQRRRMVTPSLWPAALVVAGGRLTAAVHGPRRVVAVERRVEALDAGGLRRGSADAWVLMPRAARGRRVAAPDGRPQLIGPQGRAGLLGVGWPPNRLCDRQMILVAGRDEGSKWVVLQRLSVVLGLGGQGGWCRLVCSDGPAPDVTQT